MRKAQKQDILNMIQTLHEAHEEIKSYIDRKSYALAQDILSQCQECAISIGTTIEKLEGEGFVTVSYVEAYCDILYQIHEELNNCTEDNSGKIGKWLKKRLLRVENSIKNDIVIRRETVFLPYKATMWDSLESVWKAANEDPNCDAYVIPIPYFDKNPDGSFREMHYEGDQYPAYVPITKYDEFDFGKHHPDVIFIHNPYDDANFVTSVHPFFYSDKMKKCTDCLVYIPYYSTAGGMSEGQALCPAYIHADYIVIQSEKYRKYFDSGIPDKKFLPLGSPKFDSVIQKCKNPPEPPAEWKEKLQGRKVYFYNTSIGGMLANTEAFLKKMEYVFNTFKGREDVCLLWRPHPLLESTFDSMRKQYRPAYDALKRKFTEDNIGILDLTPDIENAIALCDAYIGDGGTSVTSLFGVAGKPLFILNNNIHKLPEEDDWRGEIIKGIYGDGQNKWYVTQGNKLYHSKNNDFHYEYFCDLSKYAAGNYYQRAIEFEDKVYVCPANAQDILIFSKDKRIKKIELKRLVEQWGVFAASVQVGEYIFVLPNKYPAIVRFNMRTQEIHYITGVNDIYINEVNGERRFGGVCIWNNALLIGSPNGRKILKIEPASLKTQVFDTEIKGGIAGLTAEPDADTIWSVPYEGAIVTCWNPETGETAEYDAAVEGLQCVQRPLGYQCTLRPFGVPVYYEDKVLFPPYWGNKFVCIDRKDGIAREWEFPVIVMQQSKNGYNPLWSAGWFAGNVEGTVFRYYEAYDRKIYDINVITRECREVEIVFDKEELAQHEPGFMETSQWMQYCCNENSFNSLKDFIDEKITGNQFNKEKQLAAFSKINASIHGDCGRKVYRFVMENI